MSGRRVQVAAALLGAAALLVPGSGAAGAAPTPQGRKPQAPPPGLQLGAVRIEGQTPDVTFDVENVGENRGSLELHRSNVVQGPAVPPPAGRPAATGTPLLQGPGASVVNRAG